jgi:hypothetical protein
MVNNQEWTTKERTKKMNNNNWDNDLESYRELILGSKTEEELDEIEEMIGLSNDTDVDWDETKDRLEKIDHPAELLYFDLCAKWDEIVGM